MKTKIEQINLEDMSGELKREIKMRRRVYPRWVANNKLSQMDADLQILKLEACLALLEAEQQKNDAQGDLFR